MYFLNLSDIGDVILQALRTLMGDINAWLYTIIGDLYAVFIYISKAEIIEQSFIKEIYTRVGMILGVFMIFKLIFSLIQSLVEPDKLTDKKSGYGAVIGRSVLAIVLLGITPSLFREAFKLQNLIVGSDNKNNVIYKLIAGKSTSGDFIDLGRNLSSEVYFSFFTDNDAPYLDKGIRDDLKKNEDVLNGAYYDRMVEDNYTNLVSKVENGDATFADTVDYLAFKVGGKYVIEFNWILSLLFAIVLIWFFVTYCIQVGTRVIQLAYLQLISPIPILSYISDPDGAFKKWIKQCTTTFLDLFFRLAIIYFVMTIINDILNQLKDPDSLIITSTGLTPDDGMLNTVKIFIIIGLLMFAKRVPDLLKDLFPNMGGGAASIGFGLKSPKNMFNEIPGLKGATTLGLGATAGGIAGMATGIKNGEGFKGKLAGAFGGFGRGVAGGAKTKGNVIKNVQSGMNSTRLARQRAYEKNHDGSTFWGRNFGAGGAARTADEINREESFNKNTLTAWDAVVKELSKNQDVQKAQAEYDNLVQTGMKYDAASGTMVAANAADYKTFKDNIKNAQRNVLEKAITDKFKDNAALKSACDRFSSVGEQGKKQKYSGFNNFISINDSSVKASDRVSAFFDTEKDIKTENADINTPGGKKYEEKRKAEANAKYNNGGK